MIELMVALVVWVVLLLRTNHKLREAIDIQDKGNDAKVSRLEKENFKLRAAVRDAETSLERIANMGGLNATPNIETRLARGEDEWPI